MPSGRSLSRGKLSDRNLLSSAQRESACMSAEFATTEVFVQKISGRLVA
jgi:hypothetical protein